MAARNMNELYLKKSFLSLKLVKINFQNNRCFSMPQQVVYLYIDGLDHYGLLPVHHIQLE